ncbi:hypothetical protein L345_11857, partial [Ophiophagus hannah]
LLPLRVPLPTPRCRFCKRAASFPSCVFSKRGARFPRAQKIGSAAGLDFRSSCYTQTHTLVTHRHRVPSFGGRRGLRWRATNDPGLARKPARYLINKGEYLSFTTQLGNIISVKREWVFVERGRRTTVGFLALSGWVSCRRFMTQLRNIISAGTTQLREHHGPLEIDNHPSPEVENIWRAPKKQNGCLQMASPFLPKRHLAKWNEFPETEVQPPAQMPIPGVLNRKKVFNNSDLTGLNSLPHPEPRQQIRFQPTVSEKEDTGKELTLTVSQVPMLADHPLGKMGVKRICVLTQP